MKALTYHLELQEPLLIANPISGDENSAEGLDYIPGSVIRGALAQAYAKGKRVDLNTDKKIEQLFFGNARFLNAYLCIQDMRSLPLPLSWRKEKNAGDDFNEIFDFAIKAKKDETFDAPQRKYIYLSNVKVDEESDDEGEKSGELSKVQIATVQRHMSVHIAQQNRNKATKKGESSVFAYDALAAGQIFAGTILGDDETDLSELKRLLAQAPLKLGKSRSAGYGGVAFSNLRVVSDWGEYTQSKRDSSAMVLVTLLSDVIVRDPAMGIFSGSIESALGQKPLAQMTFSHTRVTGGFNMAWGLPLPQARTIQAGSVFAFAKTEELEKRLRVAEQSGIGERTIDGFGRIAVNWHTNPEYSVEQYKRQIGFDIKEETLAENSVEYEIAQRMVDHLWREQLDAALRNTIARVKLQNAPRNSQLSRIRLLTREAWQKDDFGLLSDVLKEPNNNESNTKAMKPHARQQFEKARVKLNTTTSLLSWLRDLAQSPKKVWNEIGVNGEKLPSIGGVIAQHPSALEYAARLIDGALRKTGSNEEEDRHE